MGVGVGVGVDIGVEDGVEEGVEDGVDDGVEDGVGDGVEDGVEEPNAIQAVGRLLALFNLSEELPAMTPNTADAACEPEKV